MTQITIESKNKGINMKEEDKKNDTVSEEKTLKEIPEETLKKIFRDLYPTNIHKTKYINDNPSLKMLALTKGLTNKNAKKEDIDDFLVKQVSKIPKSLKQLGVDWLENKKALKIDIEKLKSSSLSTDDIEVITKEVDIDDVETYCYLVQPDVNENVFSLISSYKEEKLKKQIESGEIDTGKVKELEDKIKELEKKLSDSENKQKEETNSLRQNYDIEKEKLKTKYEQRMETLKTKYDEEKAQLVKIQADSDKRFAEERKVYVEKLENIEKENKKFQDRINSIGSDLISQSKQSKDASKSLNRVQNRIEDLQTDNKELTTQNEDLKNNLEQATSQLTRYKKLETQLQGKVQELSVRVQELEKLKAGFLLNSSEILSIVKELNALDDTKERLTQLMNTNTRQMIDNTETVALEELWIKLINQEEKIVADYLGLSVDDILAKDSLKDKIDALLDLEINLKAREILVKTLYEKGYKAYKG
ncbi:MAG: hypothetical protein U0457_03990 [Candidatus Sericytochromatia bacterium]